MDRLDGHTLRGLRQQRQVSQARVARLAGVSVSHISRVESGDRSASPAVIHGYEQALQLSLTQHSRVRVISSDDRLASDQIGEEADIMKRRSFTAAIAAIAAGGPLGEPMSRAVAALSATSPPSHVGPADVVQVEQAATLFTAWDLRFGGGLAREMASAQLRWAVSLLDAYSGDHIRGRLNAAVGMLAERAAWSTFDSGEHNGARTLFKLALHAATEADNADLRAHILSDIATQQLYLGHPGDCLKVLRMAEGDDRVSSAVRFVLHGVKARALGALGDADATRQQIGRAEDAYATVTAATTPEWMSTFLTPAHVYSVTGQAAFSLAQTTGTFAEDAHARLTRAVYGFDDGRARAIALCATRLATLHLTHGHLPEGERAARLALTAAPGLRSARITEDLAAMHTAATRQPQAANLAADIGAALTAT